ncbi:hypothetical protein ACHAXA_005024 [Cyclostephanos tholiformis]|uniref:Uncharacterized protein n=1 Tax=Cyclostephanos tholiformis TaxID=382380 RepID=A0ABD3RYS1_9STRA
MESHRIISKADIVVVIFALLSLVRSPSSSTVDAQSLATEEVECVDTPDWKDMYGDNCTFYELGPKRCSYWGDKGEGKMGVANDNCCVCGGGTNVTTTTTTSPTTIITTTTTAAPGDTGGRTASPSIAAATTSPATTTSPSSTYSPTDVPPTPTPPPATMSPETSSPTSYLYSVADWENLTYSIEVDYSSLTPGHTRFCGPKIVGGYDVAVAMCSPLTECGFEVHDTHYGGNGNDCPDDEGLMCFADVICDKMPSPTPSSSPSASPTLSHVPTIFGQTKSPSSYPTISFRPSRPSDWTPKGDITTTRGSYCGTSYDDALASCSSQTTNCYYDDDCNGPEAVVDGWGMKRCYDDISCTVAGDGGMDDSSMNDYTSGGDVSSLLASGVRGYPRYGGLGIAVVVYGGMVVIATFQGFHP